MRSHSPAPFRTIGNWLVICAIFTALLVVARAASGVLEAGAHEGPWQPLAGFLPPLERNGWLDAFAAYQQSPEFLSRTTGMTLADFENVFFRHWFDGFWARLLALLFIVPALGFACLKRLPAGMGVRFLALGSLGGIQIALAWAATLPQLAGMPTALFYAAVAGQMALFGFFALLVWSAIGLLRYEGALVMAPLKTTHNLRAHTLTACTLTALTLLWGAFAAASGQSSGLVWMAQDWRELADAGMSSAFAWSSLLENPAHTRLLYVLFSLAALVVCLPLALRLKSTALGVAAFVAFCAGLPWVLGTGTPVTATIKSAAETLWLAALIYQTHRSLEGASAEG